MSNILPVTRPSDISANFLNRIVTGTGHRPQKLGGYSDAAAALLINLATDWLTALQPRGVVSGLAQGWDSALVEACWRIGFPYVACAPFKAQACKWPVTAQRRYDQYVERAAKFIICSPGEYSAHKMQVRNERMVDIALKDGTDHGLLLAVWDGSAGGTRNCIDYAKTRGLQVMNAWTDLTSRWADLRSYTGR